MSNSGVSKASSIAIMKEFKTIQNLISNLHDKTILDHIKINIKDGKERRLSKTCIKNIYLYISNNVG